MKNFSILLFVIFSITACSTKKNTHRVKHVGHEQEWDRAKISENLQYEKANQPTESQFKEWREEEENCTIMSTAQMKKSGSSACKALDPKEGYGENMFCCSTK
jgi:hypothetical protein